MAHDSHQHAAAGTALPIAARELVAGGTAAPTSIPVSLPLGCKPLTIADRVEIFGDLGGYTHGSATQSTDAQKLIDQGLVLAYNYNQGESRRAFADALAIEDAPMAYWGVAYANGPFLNKTANPAPPDMSYSVFTQEEQAAGRQAIDRGLELVNAKWASAQQSGDAELLSRLQRDKVYLEGLSPVFHAATPYGTAWREANESYARTLEAWASEHPDDVDAWALAAEAWANQQAWDFWDTSDAANPQPKGQTPHILELLDKALDLSPGHPLAAHLLVHATEGGGAATAWRAVPAARALGAANPGMGHLVHMSSHTYLRVGLWHDGVEANVRALSLDNAHADRCMIPDMPFHNGGMGIYAAATSAEKDTAVRLASDAARWPSRFGPMYMTAGHDRVQLPLVLLRFADWNALSGVQPSDLDPTQDGLMMLPPGADHYGQSMARYFEAMGAAARASAAADPEAAAAWKEKAASAVQALSESVAQQAADPITVPGTGLGIYSPAYKAVSGHAETVARARLAVLDGDWGAAIALLREATDAQGRYGYMEPPRFMQPQGECLGWALLQQGRLAEAATAYQEVLREYPRSPWALKGLRDVHTALAAAPPGTVLPNGVPTQQEVTQLLDELAAESKGAAVQLPSSCPAFSEPATAPLA